MTACRRVRATYGCDGGAAAAPCIRSRRARSLLGRYRATGADLPFGDPLPYHDGVAMEGYFWRFTDPARGRVVIALIGVNRDAERRALGDARARRSPQRVPAQRPPTPRRAPTASAWAPSPATAFRGQADRLVVDLGPTRAARRARSTDPLPWPRRSFGGSSVFHAVPSLNQYWHPWLLGGRVRGAAILGDDEWDLDGATVYCEKNWGRGGFPPAWWWGQAQGFDEPGVCVAFAGGIVTAGPLRRELTAIVVRLPDGRLIRLGDPVVSPVSADGHRRDVVDPRPRRALERRDRGRGPLGHAHVLPVPLPAERRNVPGALEHLGGTMRVVVRRRGRVVWAGDSPLAALEHGGIDRARAEARRRGAADDATHAAPRR